MEDLDELQDSPELFESLRKRFATAPVPEDGPLGNAVAPKPFVGPPAPTGADAITTSSAAPKLAPDAPSFDPSKYMVTADDLKDASDKKRNVAMLGALTDNLSNRQSFGNFFLGHMQPKNDSSAYAKTLEAQADQPIQQKQTLMKQEMQKPEVEYMKQAIDPNSEISKASAGIHKSLISSALASPTLDPNLKAVMESAASKMDGLSAYQQQQFMDKTGLSKILGSEGTSLMKMMAMMPMQQARLDLAREGLGIKKDNQAAGAAKDIDKDSLITRFQGQLSQIDIDKHTLSSAKIITPQMLHEISNGIASALNQGKSVGLGMAEMQDMSTSMTAFAAMEQKLLNQPENGASPEIRQQVLETLDRLRGGYQKAMGSRSKQLSVGKNYAHNPAAQQAQQEKVQSYQPQDEQQRVHVSNGTETRSIPASRLKEAEADGYKQVQE